MTWTPLVFTLLVAQTPTTPTQPPLSTDSKIVALENAAGLHYDDLFPRKPFFGKAATGLEWSSDERYLAYLWNPYDDKGNDLWIYDTKTGKSKRLTSIELMAQFDRKAKDAIERYKKDKLEETKMLAMNDLEYREWKLKRKEEDSKRKEPLPAYPGISEVQWNPKGNEVLFTYSGDIFRWELSKDKPERLTRTREYEAQVRYLPDGTGMTFRRGQGVLRVQFNKGSFEQLNPDLPSGVSMSGYQISPDGTKLMITASKDGPPERVVEYISYRDRFASSKKTNRGVGEDEFSGQSFIYLYDLNDDSLEGYKGDGKPWEVWKWAGGKEWQQTSVDEHPWSPDGKQFTFATWKRTTKEFEIVVADMAAHKLKTVYKSKPDGEHGTPGMAQPFFTPDGKKLIALLDAGGYRHPWTIDLATEGATPITTGEYEDLPLQLTPDGKTLFVLGNRDSIPRQNVYGVELATGKVNRLTPREGTYNTPTIAKSGKKFAMQFISWTSPRELYVIDGDEKKVTESHRGGFEKINTVQPKLISYKNRNGQDVHGALWLPNGWKPTDKRPLFIYVYGGPLGIGKSVQDGAFGTSDYLFGMYLARVFGYVTITIDPRGTSGYGNLFGKANWEQPGKAQVEDLTDGVKYLIDNYGVDPKKVGVNGWSFGGFQTQMCMYTAPDVFTLGIAGAGPTEWQNYNTWYSGGVIGPSPSGKPDDLDKYSLTYLAKNLRSPLMLLHGVEDDNVLFQDTIHVYRKLLQYGRGPLVELVVDPTGDHGMGGDMDTRDRLAIYVGFLNKWWGPYQPEK